MMITNDYNTVHAHARDAELTFNEQEHTYTVRGKELISVTTFISQLFPPFDVERHARRKAQQMGVSIEQVKAEWEQKGQKSRDEGTALHAKIEHFYQGIPSDDDPAFRLFKIFAAQRPLVPYRTEWAVYDWDYKIAGTIDFLDCQQGEYAIYDWKRSAKLIAHDAPVIRSPYGKKALPPLDYLDDTPYYHYALQLSIYKFILEKNYGIPISHLFLGIFHPDYSRPYMLAMPYLEKEIHKVLTLQP